ncbi:crustacyanin-A2 subunit-like [Homarus americanus]|uniref:crustacyanin-A2 subunit-like n=1 Tax=Homarus americanus TaxID=6706 RepID=UPI001C46AFD8|nr:crustacyanin-A2 subunit-like [Homarus americanus]
MMFLVVVMVAVVSSVAGLPAPDLSYIRNGTCLQMSTHPTLNYEKFSGVWMEVASRPNIFRSARQCVTVHLSPSQGGVESVTSAVNAEGLPSEVPTLLTPQDDPSVFTVLYHGIPTGKLSVVDTDYTTMACVYQCQQATPTQKVEWAYVYSRDLKEAAPANKRCRKVFKSQGFDVESIMSSPHPAETCNTAVAE